MRTALITISLLVLGSSTAEACQRCGIFGLRCRYAQPVVVKQQAYVAPVKQYVAPVAYPVQAQYVAAPVYQPQPLYITNVYNNPNGVAGLLAQQGSSVYGYSQAAQAYMVNPSEFLRQSAELSKAAMATASLGITSYNQSGQTQLALQASIAEPLAKGQAASQVLNAAGLSGSSQSQTKSFSLRITQSHDGNWHLEQPEAARAEVQANEHVPPPPPVPTSVISQKCAKCHGVDLSEPKGALYFDSGHKLEASTITKAIRQVRDGKMPPDGALTADEKGRLLDELISLEYEPEVFREKVQSGDLGPTR